MRTLITSLLAGVVMNLTGVSVAKAHAFLDKAVPAVGAVVSVPPREIRLTFTEGIEPAFSGIELSTAEDQSIKTPAAATDRINNTQLVLQVPSLAPGRYRVRWHVVSTDTHRSEGDYVFEVKP
jgi:methionine-rich copper-binding protein CopC